MLGFELKMYRQGDLLIKEVTEFHGDRVINRWSDDPNEFVLLKGETTGHSHKLKKPKKSILKMYENEKGDMFFEVKGSVSLVHEEHETIEFPTGMYAVIRQRVYSPKAIKYVVD